MVERKYDLEDRLLDYAARIIRLAESPKDFVHKMKICLKELRETHRCLLLIQHVPLIKPPSKADDLISETVELIRIFVTSIKTAEKRGKLKKYS